MDWRSPAFRAMLWLMLPLLAGVLFAKVRDNFNNIYILTHLKQGGVLMANDLGRRIYSSIQWLVPYSLQIALYPFLCEMVSKNDRRQLGEVLGRSCGILLMLFVPLAIILALLSHPISVLGFYGGKTGLEIATWAGISMGCYTLVLPASAVECVLMQGFFADRRMVAVTVIGIVCSSLSVLASWLFIVKVGVSPEQSLVVVALGFTLSRYLKSAVLALYMNSKVPLFAGGWLAAAGKLALQALLTAAATALAYRWTQGIWPAVTEGAVSRWRLLVQICLAGGAGALAALAWNLPALRQLKRR
jgi:peptidoglycan biosynthesis protein MviN/MurJ (putative lipid II flippase)